MNTKIFSNRNGSNIGISFLLVLLAALALTSCYSTARADGSCYISMNKRVTINVTDARPREVFDQLSDQLECKITAYPFFMRKVTVQLEDARLSDVIVAIIPQLHAKYIYNEGQLSIKPLTITDMMLAKQREEFNKMMAERHKILQSRLPEGMTFEDVPLSSVLDEISKVSGLEIKPWQDEGDRKVTVDVSGMIVDEALKAVVIYVDGEGAVLIRQKYFLHHSWGQHWFWGY